jgi:hypothetical protein
MMQPPTRIGSGAFKRCAAPSLKCPDSLTVIEEGAFFGCHWLTNAVVPARVKVIGQSAFNRCPNLASVHVQGDAPEGASDISIFTDATNVTVYYLTGTKGWGKTFGGRPAFMLAEDFLCTTETNGVTIARYKGAGGAVTIPSKINQLPVSSIGESAFRGCSKLSSLTIPNSVTVIGDRSFLDCQSLSSLTIPNSITMIDKWAFRGVAT